MVDVNFSNLYFLFKLETIFIMWNHTTIILTICPWGRAFERNLGPGWQRSIWTSQSSRLQMLGGLPWESGGCWSFELIGALSNCQTCYFKPFHFKTFVPARSHTTAIFLPTSTEKNPLSPNSVRLHCTAVRYNLNDSWVVINKLKFFQV